jgi:hypothetical protein
MPMEFVIQHSHAVSQDTFWNHIFFREDYNQRVYVQTLKFHRAEVLSQSTDSATGAITRTMLLEPRADAPAVIQKLIGSSFHYIDEGTYDPSKHTWTYRARPSKLADKIIVEGTVSTSPAQGDPNAVVRTAHCRVKANVFGVGGIIEKFLEQSTRDSYEKIARVTDAYIAEHNLGAA